MRTILTYLKGGLLIVIGILALVEPVDTLASISVYFGFSLIVRAGYLLYIGCKDDKKRSWYIYNGFIDIMFGAILLFHPDLTLKIIPFLIGIWAIMSGVLESFIATTRNFKVSWPQFLFGNIILLLGWFILMNHIDAGILLSQLLGALLILMGLGYIVLSVLINRLFFK